MSRIALFNIGLGFVIIFCSACLGAFIASDIAESFLRQTGDLHSWYNILRRSSHGHFNLFGMIHILFGLTLPYSTLTPKLKYWQTIGLISGSIAMGPGMLMRAVIGPTEQFDATGVLLGGLISLALVAIAAHAVGVFMKWGGRCRL